MFWSNLTQINLVVDVRNIADNKFHIAINLVDAATVQTVACHVPNCPIQFAM